MLGTVVRRGLPVLAVGATSLVLAPAALANFITPNFFFDT